MYKWYLEQFEILEIYNVEPLTIDEFNYLLLTHRGDKWFQNSDYRLGDNKIRDDWSMNGGRLI